MSHATLSVPSRGRPGTTKEAGLSGRSTELVSSAAEVLFPPLGVPVLVKRFPLVTKLILWNVGGSISKKAISLNY